MNLAGARVLVTGGAGFIGSVLCRALLQAKAQVVVIDNLSTGRLDNLPEGVEFFEGNIADQLLVNKIFEAHEFDYLFHLAFNTAVADSVRDPLIEMDSVKGSLVLFECAKKFGIKKTVFSSSEFIYGNPKVFPTDELQPLDPIAPYAVSKGMIEDYLLFYHRQWGVPAVILRFGTVYGPGQVNGAMTDYIRCLSQGKQAQIWGDGTKTREYVFVDDIVRALLNSLSASDDDDFPVFNVGTGVETSLNALYEQIAELLNKEPNPIYLPERAGEQMRCWLNSEKIRLSLNWEPRVSLTEGLKIRIEHFQNDSCKNTSDLPDELRFAVPEGLQAVPKSSK